jgi:uncharacterized protein YfaS (alpha-2-macroglobulin family)
VTTIASIRAGTTLRLRVTVRDVDGVLASPSTVTVKIQPPTGPVETFAPSADSTGVYHQDYTFALAGEYTVHVATTGNPTVVDEASVDVRATVVD